MVSCIFALIVGALVVVIDQLSKYYIMNNFTLGESTDFIPYVLDITYIHNKGGAWGMLSGYTWVLLSLTGIIMLICVTLLLKYGLKDKLMFWAMSLVLGGGLGNMIDRIFRDGNVVDFLHFSFWREFPVFNIADCAVVLGCGLVILSFGMSMIKDLRRRQAPLQTEAPDEQD